MNNALGLYVVDPGRLPLPIIRLGAVAWAILIGLAGFIGGLLITKRFLGYLKQSGGFIQSSLPTRQLKLVVGTASLVTALIYPCCQTVASYAGPPRTAIPNTPSYSGTVVVDDPLTSNRLGWEAIPPQKNYCVFTAAGYEVRADHINKLQTCLAGKTNFSSFALQIEMTLKSGNVGGIWFRGSYLLILLGNSFTEGYFDLYAFERDGYRTDLLPECNPIQTGCRIGESFAPQQTVTVTIVARGTSIEVYVDTFRVRTLTNGVSSTGWIGVFAELANGQHDKQTDVMFANMRIWTHVA